MNLLRVVLIARGNTKNKASPQSHSLWKSKEAGSLTSSMRNLKKDTSLTKQGGKNHLLQYRYGYSNAHAPWGSKQTNGKDGKSNEMWASNLDWMASGSVIVVLLVWFESLSPFASMERKFAE